MEKWAPISPSQPASASGAGPASHSMFNFSSVLKPSKAGPSTNAAARARAGRAGPRVGRWPEDILTRVVGFLPVPSVPAFARANRALARIARDEGTWEERCRVLGITQVNPDRPPSPAKQSMDAQRPAQAQAQAKRMSFNRPRALSTAVGAGVDDDDFGDFGDANDVFEEVDFGDFASGPSRTGGAPGAIKPVPGEKSLLDFDDVPLPSRPGAAGRSSGFFAFAPPSPVPLATTKAPGPWYRTYKRRHLELIPLCGHLRASPNPSSALALLFPPSTITALPPSLEEQGNVLLSLLRFLSPRLQPVHDWGFLRQALLAAADRFDSTCLVAFEMADTKKDQDSMRVAAEASWKVWEAGGGRRDEWECGRVWVEKREVLYETGKWDATENIMKVPDPSGTAIIKELDFTPMDAFMAHVLESFKLDAEVAVKVFPQGARVLLSFCDRVANDVIGEYIITLLNQTRIMSQDLSLRATAASFVQAWKLVDTAMEMLGSKQTDTPRDTIERVVYTMFEPHMDEYLDDETEHLQQVLDGICNAWDAELGQNEGDSATTSKKKRGQASPTRGHQPQFLTSKNPDQVKRNVLAGFRDVLLLPVTIVPRTVTFGVNAIVSGSTQAVSGLAMLNPQKWASNNNTEKGTRGKMVHGEVIFDTPVPQAGDEDEDDVFGGKANGEKDHSDTVTDSDSISLRPPDSARSAFSGATTPTSSTFGNPPMTPTHADGFERLQLLVSLDTALELIHGDRDSLKRAETFAKYPGKCGVKVVEAIEEVFILLLKAVGDRHIAPGFRIATERMLTYKPAEHEETSSVAPLLQFFELVHVGDTIQSMVQVYFDKEIAEYVDKTDFLNAVMREKKRFESILDDAVAAGLNAGIEVLMNQVEHIILVKTGPREYYPEPGAPMELGPTVGCREAIACLEMHCNLLKGSTTKEVLEVFYQEVGIRLEAILQRHLKRQIISLEGGFQIIADLNAYHNFVASLKQQRITDDFANLKMLGHVFIVHDAKDLAQIVRDVTRYGGTFTPEDVYEFIQRRSDWKKIEKTVDKAMYALSVREDCVVM